MDRTESRRRLRILLPYMAVWAALAGVLSAFVAFEITRSRTQALDAAWQGLEGAAHITAMHAQQTIGHAAGVLEALIRVQGDAAKDSSLPELVAAFSGLRPGERVAWFDQQGRPLAVDSALPPQASPEAAAIAQDVIALGGEGAEVLHVAPPDTTQGAKPVIRLLRGVHRAGQFEGALVYTLDARRLVPAPEGARQDEGLITGILRLDTIVHAADAGGQGERAAWRAAVAQRLASRKDPQDRAVRVSLEDDVLLFRREPIEHTDLVAFASVRESTALARHAEFARAILLFSLAALVALTIGLAFVARRALREVHHRSELERRYEQERRRARSDPLTGVANRTAFNDHIERCNRALTQHGTPFVLAFIDIDRFKALNDSRGHVAGDSALRRIARTLRDTVRATDLVARVGGDEFAVLMPGATAEGSPRICGKLHAALLAAAASADLGIGFSIGVVAFEEAPAQPRVVTALADRLMYDVKSAGGEGVRYGVYRRDGLHLANEESRNEIADAAS